MAYIFLCMIVGQLKSSWATSMEMIDSIRTGEMNKYLIRPISFFTYHFMMFIGHNSTFYIVYTTVLILFPILLPGWAFPTILHVIGFIAALLISIYLSYSIYFCMVCFAFWFGEVRALVIAYNISNIVLSGQIIPLRLFPDSVRNIINLTPLQFLVDFPVSIATANLPMNLWFPKMGMAFFWCIIMTVAGRVIYRSGIRVYGGYGA
jgi:ABC-2 type transport system permease protein